MVGGGIAALSGFRYQMLLALEEILVLHRDDPGGDWAVEVENSTNEKVDYAIQQGGHLTRAVQVKASLSGSSTRLSLHGEKGVATILSDLAVDFPSAPEVVFVSNRQGPWNDIEKWVSENQPACGTRLRADRDERTIEQAEHSVEDLLRECRMHEQCPSDPPTVTALAAILEARLWSLAGQRQTCTDQSQRLLQGSEVQEILSLSDQALAATLGSHTWATRWKEPAGRAIARPEVLSFLAYRLPTTDLASGRVSSACLTGFGGLGKTMAAASWAAENQGLYSMVLWMTAATPETIEADARQLLSAEHGDDAAKWSTPEVQTHLLDWLQTTARSWLLVLDDAASVDIVDGWIPSLGFGHVLITTRDAAWPISHTPSFEVGRLDDSEIRAIVDLRLGSEELSPEDLNHLISLTDRWAVAVDMVLAWIVRNGHKLADLASYDPWASRQQLLDEPGLAPAGYPEPVVAIILDALSSLEAEDPSAWALLQSTVALGSEAVPVAIASDHSNASVSELLKRDEQVAELRRRSVAHPMSVGDPRLSQWGHRLNVHDLIAQIVSQLSSFSYERWNELLRRLTSVVEDAAEQHRFALVLSLGPVVDAVDRAVLSGTPFSIHYLTLLGNTAAVLASCGRLNEAAGRLEVERSIANAQSAQLPQTETQLSEWFGLLATLQLASVFDRLDQHREALDLLAESVPRINDFHGKVTPNKLSNALELAVDVLESIRLPELAAERDALLMVARDGNVQASTSTVRLAEAHLRRDDLTRAREICEKALAANPPLMEQVDLYGKLAEALAVEDIHKSDSLLSLCQMTAQAEEIDLELPLAKLQNTVHRRIKHLLGFAPESLRQKLPTYHSWFQLHSMMTPYEHCRTWRQRLMSLISRAWLEMTNDPPDASRTVSAAAEIFRDAPGSVAPDERLGLHFLLWGTQFTSACSTLEHLAPMTQIGRRGSKILIEVSQKTWEEVPRLVTASIVTGAPQVNGHRFGPYVLVTVGNWGLTFNATEFDPFTRIDGAATICLLRPGALDVKSRTVDPNAILELGDVHNLQPDADFTIFRRTLDEIQNMNCR